MGKGEQNAYREQIQDAFDTLGDVYGTGGRVLQGVSTDPRDYNLETIAGDALALADRARDIHEVFEMMRGMVLNFADILGLETEIPLWARTRRKGYYTPTQMEDDMRTLKAHAHAVRHHFEFTIKDIAGYIAVLNCLINNDDNKS